MDTNPEEAKRGEPKIPDYFLKLVDGCSFYTKLSNQYWIVVAFFSIFAIFPSLKDGYVELPFSLGRYEESVYSEVAFFFVGVSIVCFTATFAQALRARRLVQRAADAIVDQCILPGPVYLQDAMGILLHPSFTRVSPIAHTLQFKKRFFPEAAELPIRKRERGFWFYFGLKMIAVLVVCIFPGFALGYSFYSSLLSDARPSYAVLTAMVILLLYSEIALLVLAADELVNAFKVRKRLRNSNLP